MLNTETEVSCAVTRLQREMAPAEPSAYMAAEIEIDRAKQVVSGMTGTALPGTGRIMPSAGFSLKVCSRSVR